MTILVTRQKGLEPGRQLAVGGRPDPIRGGGAFASRRGQPDLAAVGADDVEADDVLRRGAPGYRVGPAGVVADHAPERAATVRGRVGAESKAVREGQRVQVVEHDAGFDGRRASLGVEVDDAGQRARRDEHARPDGIPGDAGAGAAHRQGRPGLAADPGHGGQPLDIGRLDHESREHPVERRVRRVEGPAADVGAHPVAEDGTEPLFDPSPIRPGEAAVMPALRSPPLGPPSGAHDPRS